MSKIQQEKLLQEARSCIGKPYIYGGNLPKDGGTDCSGLCHYSYSKIGVSIPRTSKEQSKIGVPILNKEDLVAGDLIFSMDSSGNIYHVFMYSENGNVIEAQKDGTLIKEHSNWKWQGIARRILKDTPKEEKPKEADVFYRVVCGSYEDRVNAEKMMAELKQKGYNNTFITVYEIV